MKILVIDDDAQFLAKARKFLEMRGYSTFGAPSEASAREILRVHACSIRVALVDLYMESPDSGISVVRHIISHYGWIRPVVMTGHVDPERTEACVAAGAAAIYKKDQDAPEMLLRLVQQEAAASGNGQDISAKRKDLENG